MAAIDIYQGKNPRDLPAFTVTEAAQYVHVPARTLRDWTATHGLIEPAQLAPRLLSFWNVVEAHVLSSIRKQRLSLQKVRKALSFIQDRFSTKRPFLEEDFITDGVALFVEKCGVLTSVSDDGQLAMREVLNIYLTRIERDEQGISRLFPFVGPPEENSRRSIVMDPFISFGRPTVAGTGVPTRELAERYWAGDWIKDIADDFALSPEQVEDAVRCEPSRVAA